MAAYITTVTLTYTYMTNVVFSPATRAQQQPQQPVLQQQQQQAPNPTVLYTQQTQTPRPTTTTTFATTTTTARPKPTQKITHDPKAFDNMCGVSFRKDTTGLVKGGNVVTRGQFPWLVAYFHIAQTTQFICGGSLVSTKIVVTAAHCVQGKGETEAKLAKDSIFYMGKHNVYTLAGKWTRFYLQSRTSLSYFKLNFN